MFFHVYHFNREHCRSNYKSVWYDVEAVILNFILHVFAFPEGIFSNKCIILKIKIQSNWEPPTFFEVGWKYEWGHISMKIFFCFVSIKHLTNKYIYLLVLSRTIHTQYNTENLLWNLQILTYVFIYILNRKVPLFYSF